MSVNTGVITDCYAVSSVQGGSANAFFVSNSGSIADIYCITKHGESYLTITNTDNNRHSYSGLYESLREILNAFAESENWGSAVNSHPYDTSLGGGYPFPAVVKNTYG